MCADYIIRRFAGVFILLSLALGYWVHPAWFLFTAFVGINLLQSSVPGFCPLERVLGRFGLAGCSAARDAAGRSGREDAPAGPGL
jgi:hypothetical protein